MSQFTAINGSYRRTPNTPGGFPPTSTNPPPYSGYVRWLETQSAAAPSPSRNLQGVPLSDHNRGLPRATGTTTSTATSYTGKSPPPATTTHKKSACFSVSHHKLTEGANISVTRPDTVAPWPPRTEKEGTFGLYRDLLFTHEEFFGPPWFETERKRWRISQGYVDPVCQQCSPCSRCRCMGGEVSERYSDHPATSWDRAAAYYAPSDVLNVRPSNTFL